MNKSLVFSSLLKVSRTYRVDLQCSNRTAKQCSLQTFWTPLLCFSGSCSYTLCTGDHFGLFRPWPEFDKSEFSFDNKQWKFYNNIPNSIAQYIINPDCTNSRTTNSRVVKFHKRCLTMISSRLNWFRPSKVSEWCEAKLRANTQTGWSTNAIWLGQKWPPIKTIKPILDQYTHNVPHLALFVMARSINGTYN